MENNLENLIEAVLFHRAGSMKKKDLAKLLEVKSEDIEEAVAKLKQNLLGRGVSLALLGDEIMLRTSPETSGVIEQITKEELSKDLGKAGLETLSIILYNHPISTREIEYIRGVKSSFILRNLTMRGLVERITNPKDSRSYLYKPTFETLGFLGVNEVSDLPEYTKTKNELEQFVIQQEEQQDNDE